MNDIVLVTIDSWRRDSIARMPNLSKRTDEWNTATGVSHSSKTYLAFPSMLASSLPTASYDDSGSLVPDVNPLPRVLSEAGYSTGGFIASNPNVQQWEQYFDTFWNDGIADATEQYTSKIEKWRKRILKTVLMRKQVSAETVARRAKQWYVSTNGPRFLWMHLMEPHFPYYPGIRKAADVGLFSSYQTTVDFHRHREAVADEHRDTLEALYYKTVERLDDQIGSILDFLDDDATVVITGDHGEEFQHDVATHDHLYEECVTVPLLTNNLPSVSGVEYLRHLDIAPTILDRLGIDPPAEWEGDVAREVSTKHPVRMANILGKAVYTGVRTDDRKILKTFETDGSTAIEWYDLANDPAEQHDLSERSEPPEMLSKELDAFIDSNDLDTVRQDAEQFISDVATDRLEELGYV